MPTEYTHKYLFPGDDLTDAYAVRKAVFVDEQGFDLALEFDAVDSTAHHTVLYVQGKPIGTGRVFAGDEPGLYVIGRVAVLPEHRGGTGRTLMLRLQALAKEIGAKAITLGAQCQAQGFYAGLGYVPYGEQYFDEHCPHINMKKVL